MNNKGNNVSQKACNSDLICLAEITSPHGIKGAVKLKTYTKSPSDILYYKNLKDQMGNLYKVRILSIPTSSSLIVNLTNITDRNQAEKLRGVKLYVSRVDLPDLTEDEFYHADLIGMAVFDLDGNKLGELLAVNNHGAGDFLDIKMINLEILSIPFRKEAVPHVDVATKSIIIDPNYLLRGKV